ncbi:MAG: Ig-like domain-containing protein [Alphaproteobacteria bacterium]|nr:Ig-like domain-containing protein [Alphaproteobacteria bacterium]
MVHPLRRLLLILASIAAAWPEVAAAVDGSGGRVPSLAYDDRELHQLITPSMGHVRHNQPSMVDGWLMLSGNGTFELWDISDPYAPERVSSFESPDHAGEAESHSVSFHKTADGRTQAATISGTGVDLWDLADAAHPTRLASVALEGVHYGDNTEAVWGVAWQGDVLYVGGTNTGLHLVDVVDPTAPRVVARIPTTALGGVSAGPLWAVGNLLVVTTPKEYKGVATLDISDPLDPVLLDAVVPENKSYIGGFYGGDAWLLTPLRRYDVTTDPSHITLVSTVQTPTAEYMSFADGWMFMSSLRPTPGVWKLDPYDAALTAAGMTKIEGRHDDPLGGFFTDDQFSMAVGNLVVLSDDEVSIGSVLAVHDTEPDTHPPQVLYVNPPDGARQQALTTRVGLSLSDPIDSRSIRPDTIVVRPLDGAPLTGSWSLNQTVVTFWPDTPLAPDTTYEIVLPAGGLADVVGNPMAAAFTSVFSTGEDVAALHCAVAPIAATAVGAPLALTAEDAGPDVTYSWTVGEAASASASAERTFAPTLDVAGRYPVRLTVHGPQGSRSCAAVAVVHTAPLATRPVAASTVAVDEASGRAWVVDADADTVTVVDLATRSVVGEHVVGDHPRTVAVLPDGRAIVANQDDDTVCLVDPLVGAVDTLALPWGARPYGVVVTPDGRTAYVSEEGGGAVAVLDVTGGLSHVATWPVPRDDGGLIPQVRGLAWLPSGGLVVTRWISPADRGQGWELSTDDGAVVRELSLRFDPGPDDHDKGRGVPNGLGNVAVSPDGVRLALPSAKANTARGTFVDGEALDADNTVRTIVSWVDLTTGAELEDARLDLDDHEQAVASAYSPHGDLLFVVSQGTAQVDVLDVATGARVAGASTGAAPQGVAVTDDGLLLVQDSLDRTLSIYDATGVIDGTDGALHLLERLPTVAVEPLDPVVLRGKRLFHDARSPRISQDGYLTCATCHPDGGGDGRTWDFTSRGEGLRNTIDLRGKAGMGHGPLHWTANFDEVQDFEDDIRLHMGGSGLMADADFDAGDRADPLGAPKAGLSDDLDALAAYVTSLDRFPRSPYRNADGSLTDDALRGRRLLERLDCLTCHGGPTLTDSADGTRHDVGSAGPGSGGRRGGALDGFDTPTLLGLHATAPYLHDGSAATLEEVLALPGHGDAQALSARQTRQLVALLLQLENDLPEPTAGCACDGRGRGPAAWVVVLLVAVARRRRRWGRAGRAAHMLLGWLLLVGCGGGAVVERPLPDAPAGAAFGVVHVDAPSTFWPRSGFTPMVPPVPLPSAVAGQDTVEVWVRVPADARLAVVDGPDGPTLRWPAGAAADRVEWRGTGEGRHVVDVRGTILDADGVAWDHLYRPAGVGPEAPLLGVRWPASDVGVRAAAVAWLGDALADRPPMAPASTEAKARWRESLERKAVCTSCHVPLRPANARPGAHGLVDRGTDANGWFTPATLLADDVPMETYSQDRSAAVSAVSVRCGSEAAHQGVRGTWACPDGSTPIGHLDLAAAWTSDPDHAAAVCAGRRWLADHLDETGLSRWPRLLEGCNRSNR